MGRGAGGAGRAGGKAWGGGILTQSPNSRISVPGNIFGKGEGGQLGPVTSDGQHRWVFAWSRKTGRSYDLAKVNIQTGKIIDVISAPWRKGSDNRADAEAIIRAIKK